MHIPVSLPKCGTVTSTRKQLRIPEEHKTSSAPSLTFVVVNLTPTLLQTTGMLCLFGKKKFNKTLEKNLKCLRNLGRSDVGGEHFGFSLENS